MLPPFPPFICPSSLSPPPPQLACPLACKGPACHAQTALLVSASGPTAHPLQAHAQARAPCTRQLGFANACTCTPLLPAAQRAAPVLCPLPAPPCPRFSSIDFDFQFPPVLQWLLLSGNRLTSLDPRLTLPTTLTK